MIRNRHAHAEVLALIPFCIIGIIFVAYHILSKPSSLVKRLNLSYVIVDLRSRNFYVTPEIADGKYSTEQFSYMMARLRPFAAITGTYYDNDGKPIGDIVKDGKIIHKGYQRQGIGFTKYGKIKFVERKGHSRINWRGCESGIACGPRLVKNGKVCIDVRKDGFSDNASQSEARRCAVGATKDGKLILCAVRDYVTLNTLAKVMIELGAKDAINLDGGSMCALYKDGEVCAHPMKPMSNVLAVYKK